MIAGIAVLGKDNNPLYIRAFGGKDDAPLPQDEQLRFHPRRPRGRSGRCNRHCAQRYTASGLAHPATSSSETFARI